MRRADTTVEELGRQDTAWRLMAPWGVTPLTAEMERHAVYTFRGRWAHSWRTGNVFLAGDAAHLMPPFLGQGLCSGLRDAWAMSWRLAMVHQGSAEPAILDTYGPERTGHVQEIIEGAVAAGRVICELDVEKAALRDAEMRERATDPVAVTREPPHPRLGFPSLTIPSDGSDGLLSPQGRVRAEGQVGLFDDVVGGGWQLISRGGDPAELLRDEDIAWFRGIGGVFADVSYGGSVEDLDGAYERWFQKNGCAAFVSRPDFYVFAAGEHADIPSFLAQLRSAIQPVVATGE